MQAVKPMSFAIVVVAVATLIELSSPQQAAAQGMDGKAVNADAVSWGPAPPMLPKGAQLAVLSGDPGKEGPFAVRLKMPAGYKIPAHSHPTYEAVTVISGDFNVGMGDKLDEAKAEKLKASSFINLPEKMNHFAFATSESVVQINSDGPFAITYVNSADDPRNTK